MFRSISLALFVLTATSSALAAPAPAKAPELSRWQRFRQSVKRLGRRASVFVAPVRVSRRKDGTVKLVRYAVDKKGEIVPAEEIIQFKSGLVHRTELTYKLVDGKRVERREVERMTLLPGRTTRNRFAVNSDGTLVEPTAVPQSKEVYEDGKLKHRTVKHAEPKKLTLLGAYWKAVRESPVAEFAATTGTIFLALELGLPALGVHLAGTIGSWFGVSKTGGAIIGALAPKALTLPVIAVRALSKQRLKEERPKWISKRVWKLMSKEADKHDEAKHAVAEARELLDQPDHDGSKRQQANELVAKAKDAKKEAHKTRTERKQVEREERRQPTAP